MHKRTLKPANSDRFEPSLLVRRFASQIATAAEGKPVLDVACGSGRNAMALSELGCPVICIDKDLASLRAHQAHWRNSSLKEASGQLNPYQLDLVKEPWPFAPYAAGGIINVHFLLPALFQLFERSLSPGGYLLLETVSGHGGNYLELPRAGELRAVFEKRFQIDWYRERKVGPHDCNAATVQLFAKKLSD